MAMQGLSKVQSSANSRAWHHGHCQPSTPSQSHSSPFLAHPQTHSSFRAPLPNRSRNSGFWCCPEAARSDSRLGMQPCGRLRPVSHHGDHAQPSLQHPWLWDSLCPPKTGEQLGTSSGILTSPAAGGRQPGRRDLSHTPRAPFCSLLGWSLLLLPPLLLLLLLLLLRRSPGPACSHYGRDGEGVWEAREKQAAPSPLPDEIQLGLGVFPGLPISKGATVSPITNPRRGHILGGKWGLGSHTGGCL